MAGEIKLIQTTPEIYFAILRAHSGELVPFGTISQPDGDMYGDHEVARMYTEWGFKTADYPVIAHDESWPIDRDRPGVRVGAETKYYLCVARSRY